MPLTPPDKAQMIESLRSRIVEGRTLNPYEYRPVVVPLQVVLGPTRQQGQASFNIPSNQRFLIRQFIPIVVPSNVSATGNAMDDASFLTTGGAENLVIARAQNCKIDLGLNSRMYNLFQQFSFPLSDLLFQYGGEGNLKDMPGILVQGTTIDLTASLSDINAAGADTQYGLLLAGFYIQTAQS